jgi:hypothetical protein
VQITETALSPCQAGVALPVRRSGDRGQTPIDSVDWLRRAQAVNLGFAGPSPGDGRSLGTRPRLQARAPSALACIRTLSRRAITVFQPPRSRARVLGTKSGEADTSKGEGDLASAVAEPAEAAFISGVPRVQFGG